MLAAERLLEIAETYGDRVRSIVPLELDGEALRLILHLKDGANLRVTEQWQGNTVMRYSYYWLTVAGDLKKGWDNAPHHTHLENFPHHVHIERQENLQPSSRTCLEEVMAIILGAR